MDIQPIKDDKPKTRLEALADGTFAIVFTILVLELIIKDVHFNNADSFKNLLLSLLPKFLSYILSFAILASYWIGHVEQLYFVTHINRQFILTNLLFLFFITLIPFSTTLISGFRQFPLSARIYGINLLCCQLSFYLNWRLASSSRLQEQRLERKIIKGHQHYIILGLALQSAGIGFSYINAGIGLFILALVPIIYIILFAADKKGFKDSYTKTSIK
ncbi:MAG: TMEM175 family protein [Ferruginibacter sp.]